MAADGARRAGIAAAGASLLLAAAASAVVLFAPLTSEASASATATADGSRARRATEVVRRRPTLWAQEGLVGAGLVAVPIAVAALPLAARPGRAARPLRVVSAALLTTGSVLAGFSVGLFYLPAAGAMIVAAILPAPRPGPVLVGGLVKRG